MSRLLLFAAIAVTLAFASPPAGGDEPAPEKSKARDPKTYTVSCKLTQRLRVNSGDKENIETINSKIPDVTTLEATRGEYYSGKRLNAAPYGFQLQAEVRPVAGDRVRFEVTVENGSSFVERTSRPSRGSPRAARTDDYVGAGQRRPGRGHLGGTDGT